MRGTILPIIIVAWLVIGVLSVFAQDAVFGYFARSCRKIMTLCSFLQICVFFLPNFLTAFPFLSSHLLGAEL